MAKRAIIKPLLYLVILVLAGGSALYLLRDRGPREGLVATVWVDGAAILKIPMDGAEDRDFSISGDTGKQITFRVREGAVRFLSSDCPDKVCVNAGFLHEDGDIASCLPNHTVLTVAAEKLH